MQVIKKKNQTTMKRKSDLLVTSIITDKIGPHKVLVIIKNMTKVEKETRHWLHLFIKNNSSFGEKHSNSMCT